MSVETYRAHHSLALAGTVTFASFPRKGHAGQQPGPPDKQENHPHTLQHAYQHDQNNKEQLLGPACSSGEGRTKLKYESERTDVNSPTKPPPARGAVTAEAFWTSFDRPQEEDKKFSLYMRRMR